MILLNEPHDYDQLWLPLSDEPVYFPAFDYRDEYRARPFHDGANNMSWSREEVATTQYVLCFPRAGNRPSSKGLTHKQFKRLKEHGFPTFERNRGDNVLELIPQEPSHVVQKWCEEHCRNRYYASGMQAVFETKYDYVHALLSGHFVHE